MFEQICTASDDMDQPNADSNFEIGEHGLCTQCVELFAAIAKAQSMNVEIVGDFKAHHESATAIKESSQNGCKVCTLLIEAYGLEEFEKDSLLSKQVTQNPDIPDLPQIHLDNQSDEWAIGLRLEGRIRFDRLLLFSPMEDGISLRQS